MEWSTDTDTSMNFHIDTNSNMDTGMEFHTDKRRIKTRCFTHTHTYIETDNWILKHTNTDIDTECECYYNTYYAAILEQERSPPCYADLSSSQYESSKGLYTSPNYTIFHQKAT